MLLSSSSVKLTKFLAGGSAGSLLSKISRKNNFISKYLHLTTTTMSGEATRKLREFGYAFNKEGKLRKVDSSTGEPGNEPFQFDVYPDYGQNQRHYEELANCIPEIIYELLEQNGMVRVYTPENVPKEQATFIFTSREKLDKPKKLLVLIHGSGYVRAGQWARSLIINNSLDHGTVLPYIKKARELGYDILVTNTNDNYRESEDGTMKVIPGHNNPINHAVTVWEKYVAGSSPESVAIVAHSYGGSVTLALAKQFEQFFKHKVFAVALTDSAHFSGGHSVVKNLRPITRNFVSSDKPLGTVIKTPSDDLPQVSAGHTKHEWTSYSAMSAVFEFIEQRYEEFLASSKSKTEL
ncbi:FAM172 family protein homolog CG10038 [Episyrphus balteatus]|uniref:FAM172 family protein homolog CG10038 n=1 Tax=Episyrphus balteatus TaxID=286459 RepID=UPI0024860C20|nr:FAM172 family protein homolog CG10038 [Episyrphus balteatus]